MREEGEGAARVGLLAGRRQGGAVPEEVLGVVQPQVRQVLCALARVLEAAEQDDVVLEVGHAVPAAGGRGLVASLGCRFDTRPFPGRRVQPPEVVVVVEGPLLRRRELPAEQPDAARVAAAGPGVARARQRRVGARDQLPVRAAGVVDVEVVVEGGEGAVKVFAAEEEELVRVGWGAGYGAGGAGGGGLRGGFGDLVELLLLE